MVEFTVSAALHQNHIYMQAYHCQAPMLCMVKHWLGRQAASAMYGCAAQAWREGGYSDDLTVASVCGELGLKIICPSFAIFPQWHAPKTCFCIG